MNDAIIIHAAVVAGRVMIAFVFVYGAFRRHFKLRFMGVDMLAKRGLPWPRLMLNIATVYQIVAGSMLALGILLLPVALSLIAFTVLASWLVLDFWNKQGPERIAAESGWQSNVGIIGGLIILAFAKL